MRGMSSAAAICALCDRAIDGGGPAHAVGGKFICEACRQIVLAGGPRHVLPYAGGGPARHRRWLLPSLAAIVVAALLLSLLFMARIAAVQRARAAELRALIAQQNARAAAAAQARPAATQPRE